VQATPIAYHEAAGVGRPWGESVSPGLAGSVYAYLLVTLSDQPLAAGVGIHLGYPSQLFILNMAMAHMSRAPTCASPTCGRRRATSRMHICR
jgi:hypothetical protein